MIDLRQSKVWDARYDLPLFPELNNPWAYGAYAWRLMGYPEKMETAFDYHAMECELTRGRIRTGLFYRWPDGSGGKFSHDEIIGMAYISGFCAGQILSRLNSNDGLYNHDDTEADNMYRFIFLEPFLRQCAGLKVSYMSQAKYIAHILFSAFTWKQDSGSSGPLKIWLMNDKMKDLPLCAVAIMIYDKIMQRKGVTLHWMIKEHFPQYPELLECVKESV